MFVEERKYPEILQDIKDAKETLWLNHQGIENCFSREVTLEDVENAEKRLQRFAPYLAQAFPETAGAGGLIESPLVEIEKCKGTLVKYLMKKFPSSCELEIGKLLLKCDSHLPVSGSVKARGGIYEVLKFAEEVALREGLIDQDFAKTGKRGQEDYRVFASPEFRRAFEKYSVAVGSTGNLGLSIGIISAKLGFDVTVHMSADARQWKKDLLRTRGAKVVEYQDSYQKAVAEGRREAAGNPMCHFVDDESSLDLFTGYATSGKRVKKQLEELKIKVDEQHPLFVYIPCGVGGAPGGVTYGLKQIFGKHVHVFFAEPTQAPCMVLGMSSGLHDGICVEDVGLTGKTAADGLAVGRPSKLVGKAMEKLLDGISTIDDDWLYCYERILFEEEDIFIEPSACATFDLPFRLAGLEKGRGADKKALKALGIDEESIKKGTHMLWATGGNMVPKEEKNSYLELGHSLLLSLS